MTTADLEAYIAKLREAHADGWTFRRVAIETGHGIVGVALVAFEPDMDRGMRTAFAEYVEREVRRG